MNLFSILKEDFATVRRLDPAIKSRFELFFNYPGLIAIAHYRVAHRLYLRGFCRLARVIMGLTQLITSIDIHPACVIGRRVFIDHGIGVVIGETAILKDDITIYQGVTLGGVSLERVKRHPTIESGVVIGAGAKILGNITIGENARIGANSVVITDVPPNVSAVGIPARVIEKGRMQDSSAINKIPDIDRVLFCYLIKRLKLLESRVEDERLKAELSELDRVYESFAKAVGDQ